MRATDHRDTLTEFVKADTTSQEEAAIALGLRGRFEAAIKQLHEMERDDGEITPILWRPLVGSPGVTGVIGPEPIVDDRHS